MLHYGRFRLALASASEENWRELSSFVSHYSHEFNLSTVPVVFFGAQYYSSGAFTYYKGLSLRLQKDYFVISVDRSDPPIFWPLVLHELSHCSLGSRDDVDRICGRHAGELRRITWEVAQRRLEESLCDALATRLIGPAYPHSYLNKLWARLSIPVELVYPSHEFRIECIASVLDGMKLFEEAGEIRELRDERFSKSWTDEEISFSLDDITDVASKIHTRVTSDVTRRARAFLKGPNKSIDLPSLLLACWMTMNESSAEEMDLMTDSASQTVLKHLGQSEPSNSTA